MHRLDRRDFLASAAAAIAVPALPVARGAATSEADDAERLLGEVAEALLAEYPESASALGIDKGARAALKARLADRSLGGRGSQRVAAEAWLARLRAIDRGRLGAAARLDLDVATAAH